jgi:hypothetical protein
LGESSWKGFISQKSNWFNNKKKYKSYLGITRIPGRRIVERELKRLYMVRNTAPTENHGSSPTHTHTYTLSLSHTHRGLKKCNTPHNVTLEAESIFNSKSFNPAEQYLKDLCVGLS